MIRTMIMPFVHAVLRTRIAIIALIVCVAAGDLRAVERASSDGVWRIVDGAAAGAAEIQPRIEPEIFRLVSLDQGTLMSVLDRVSLEASPTVLQKKTVLTIPLPDGSFARFEVVESPIMAPELAAKFPDIKTYIGQGLDDTSASVRFDWTPKGFHAQILSAGGATYVEPRFDGDTRNYVVYQKRDYRRLGNGRTCSVLPGVQNQLQDGAARAASVDTTLRTYRHR